MNLLMYKLSSKELYRYKACMFSTNVDESTRKGHFAAEAIVACMLAITNDVL